MIMTLQCQVKMLRRHNFKAAVASNCQTLAGNCRGSCITGQGCSWKRFRLQFVERTTADENVLWYVST